MFISQGHKFLLGTASPVLSKLLYEWDGDEDKSERRLTLDPRLAVTITLSKSYFSDKIEWEGIPPIAAEALLEYIYKDKYADYVKQSGTGLTNKYFLGSMRKTLRTATVGTCCGDCGTQAEHLRWNIFVIYVQRYCFYFYVVIRQLKQCLI